MVDFLLGTLAFFLRAVGFVLDIARFITDTQRLARLVTGSDKLVAVPPDPKPLPPAAQRALAEADERERNRKQAAQTASGTVQAS
jgi:hypothetical protein